MPRKRSKYGIEAENLTSLIINNFLAWAKNPEGARYEKGLREFYNDPNRVLKYTRRTRSHFIALKEVMKEDPMVFKKALRPVYDRVVQKRSEIMKIPVTTKGIEIEVR